MLYLDSEDPIRLKAFTSTSRGAKATIRIELETEDMSALGYFLSHLTETHKAQQAPKPKGRLALPKPEVL